MLVLIKVQEEEAGYERDGYMQGVKCLELEIISDENARGGIFNGL